MNAAPPPTDQQATGQLPEHRPRVAGDRELEILNATLDVLADVGYDRLTMDAVAARARASKATLYRRWSSKPALVIDAFQCQKGPDTVPDTGSLREDLIASACGHGGLTDPKPLGVFASVMTAISRDADFAEAWRRDFVGPKIEAVRQIYRRAQARGEVRADADLDLLASALAAIVLHRAFVLGDPPTLESVTAVVDQVILPACRPDVAPPTSPNPDRRESESDD